MPNLGSYTQNAWEPLNPTSCMLTRGLTNKLPVMLNIRDIPKGVHTVEKKRRTVSTIRSTTNLHTPPPQSPPTPFIAYLKTRTNPSRNQWNAYSFKRRLDTLWSISKCINIIANSDTTDILAYTRKVCI